MIIKEKGENLVVTPAERKKAIKDFEKMIDMAKLKAYSNLSLERPLTNAEYDEFMALGKKLGYKR